ncbi:MAG: DUF3784 domain-containing protein [Desulfobacterales bacterium]|nr:MAG: DUF3784 domain-containing protein [Desulfobacterales bacterium]
MTSKLIEILVMESIALLLFIFAYLIGVKGKLELIAGYNERTASKVKDKDGLKRLITRLCVLVGVGSAFMPILTHFASGNPAWLAYSIGGYGGFILGVIGIVMLQSKDYTA